MLYFFMFRVVQCYFDLCVNGFRNNVFISREIFVFSFSEAFRKFGNTENKIS